MKFLVATSNPNKVREIRQILYSFPEIEIEGLENYSDVEMPEETGTTFTENARIKAVSVTRQTGMPCLADDSGLCVNALGGFPGINSNRFAGEDTTPQQRNVAILRLLAGKPYEERGARFACAACAAFPDGSAEETLELCEGFITDGPQGDGGFGYDPIFYMPQFDCTLAEVSAQEKNMVSHRGKAFRALAEKLLKRVVYRDVSPDTEWRSRR